MDILTFGSHFSENTMLLLQAKYCAFFITDLSTAAVTGFPGRSRPCTCKAAVFLVSHTRNWSTVIRGCCGRTQLPTPRASEFLHLEQRRRLYVTVPKMARGKISLARGLHCRPNFLLFILPDHRLSTVHAHTHTHTHTYICCLQTVYEIPLLPNHTAVKRFYTNWSGANC